jgi:3D (Asp-Asp-Asp) domain-containing protein
MVGLISIILLASPQDTVTATTYKLTARENGPYGNVLASGFRANKEYPGDDRVVAVSRDLLKKYPLHTDVLIKGAGKLDGIWKVEDVMNKRFRKRIDFLLNWKVKHNKFNNVIITSYGKHKSDIRHRKHRVNDVHDVRAKQHHYRTKNTNHKSENTK